MAAATIEHHGRTLGSPSVRRRLAGGLTGMCGDAELFTRWQRDRDEAARDELILRFSPLSRKLARRYCNTSESHEDLYQVAQLGLLKAIDGYDGGRGAPFTAYAVPTILGELRRHFRSSSWAAHVPRGAQERAIQVREAERVLADEQGRSPTVSEVARHTSLSVEEVLDAMQALRALGSLSLDAPRGGEAGDEEISYEDLLGGEDVRYELVELGADLTSALRLLEPRQREILRLRFFEEMTQSQIAEKIGVSQMQVSRLLSRCLAELRGHIEAGASEAPSPRSEVLSPRSEVLSPRSEVLSPRSEVPSPTPPGGPTPDPGPLPQPPQPDPRPPTPTPQPSPVPPDPSPPSIRRSAAVVL